eukprot:COSAG06_NODE_72818_length_165_cov_3536.030303_1_plen_36_part_01
MVVLGHSEQADRPPMLLSLPQWSSGKDDALISTWFG